MKINLILMSHKKKSNRKKICLTAWTYEKISSLKSKLNEEFRPGSQHVCNVNLITDVEIWLSNSHPSCSLVVLGSANVSVWTLITAYVSVWMPTQVHRWFPSCRWLVDTILRVLWTRAFQQAGTLLHISHSLFAKT